MFIYVFCDNPNLEQIIICNVRHCDLENKDGNLREEQEAVARLTQLSSLCVCCLHEHIIMMHLPTRLSSEGLSLDGRPAVVTLSLSYITSGENYYGTGEDPGFFLSVPRISPSLESRRYLYRRRPSLRDTIGRS